MEAIPDLRDAEEKEHRHFEPCRSFAVIILDAQKKGDPRELLPFRVKPSADPHHRPVLPDRGSGQRRRGRPAGPVVVIMSTVEEQHIAHQADVV